MPIQFIRLRDFQHWFLAKHCLYLIYLWFILCMHKNNYFVRINGNGEGFWSRWCSFIIYQQGLTGSCWPPKPWPLCQNTSFVYLTIKNFSRSIHSFRLWLQLPKRICTGAVQPSFLSLSLISLLLTKPCICLLPLLRFVIFVVISESFF